MSPPSRIVVLRHAAVAAFCAAGYTLFACNQLPQPIPPCYGLGVGSKVEITIGALDTHGLPRVVGPNAGCVDGFDLAEGEVIDAAVADVENDPMFDCGAAVPAFESTINGWAWAETKGFSGPAVLNGVYSASKGSCQGLVTLGVWSNVPDPFHPPVGGVEPSVFVSRNFLSDNPDAAPPSCPAECSDDFAVTLKRL